MSQSKNYNLVDCIKFLCAFLVVCIHVMPASILKERYDSVLVNCYDITTRMAVPFFFMASAYFQFVKIKDKNDFQRIKQMSCRMGKLYVLWSLIYLPINIYGYVQNGTPPLKAVAAYIIHFLFLGEHWYSYPLWYLLSSTYFFYAIYFLISRKIKPYYILAISAIVYLFAFFISEDLTSGYWRLLTGFLYLSFGMCVAYYRNRISINGIVFLPLTVVFYIISILTDNVIAKLLLYFSFFITIISINIPDSKFWKYLRKTSTITYFTHMIIFFSVTLYVGFSDRYSWINLMLVSLFCLLLSLILLIKPIRDTKLFKLLFG